MNKNFCDLGTHDIHTETLDKIRQRLQLRFSDHEIQRMGLEMFYEQMERQLIVRIERWFVGQHMPAHTFEHTADAIAPKIQTPRGWWQCFKHDYCDRWWMRAFVNRWPVAYDEFTPRVTLTVRNTVAFDVLYPDFKVPYGFENERKIIIPRFEP